MSDKAWWVDAAQWTLWGVIMAVIMGWLEKSRLRRRPATQAGRLAHPPSTLIMGLICVGLFGSASALCAFIFSRVPPELKTLMWLTTAGFIGFTALSSPMVINYFRAKHDVSPEGLSCGKWVGAHRFLRWSELRSVRYAPTLQWFRLETQDGSVARISAMLMGLPEFARLVLEHTPANAIDAKTLPVLQATAKGTLPSLWTES